jgi:hypothetical protein
MISHVISYESETWTSLREEHRLRVLGRVFGSKGEVTGERSKLCIERLKEL